MPLAKIESHEEKEIFSWHNDEVVMSFLDFHEVGMKGGCPGSWTAKRLRRLMDTLSAYLYEVA